MHNKHTCIGTYTQTQVLNFLNLSNLVTTSVPGIFHTNMTQKNLPHQNSAKNNNPNYQNMFKPRIYNHLNFMFVMSVCRVTSSQN